MNNEQTQELDQSIEELASSTTVASATRVIEAYVALNAGELEAGREGVNLDPVEKKLYDSAAGYLSTLFDTERKILEAVTVEEVKP